MIVINKKTYLSEAKNLLSNSFEWLLSNKRLYSFYYRKKSGFLTTLYLLSIAIFLLNPLMFLLLNLLLALFFSYLHLIIKASQTFNFSFSIPFSTPSSRSLSAKVTTRFLPSSDSFPSIFSKVRSSRLAMM